MPSLFSKWHGEPQSTRPVAPQPNKAERGCSPPGLRVLLDTCVPKRLATAIDGYVVASVIDLGRAALADGELLDRMAGSYDVLLTVDRGIRHQQRLHDRTFWHCVASGQDQSSWRPPSGCSTVVGGTRQRAGRRIPRNRHDSGTTARAPAETVGLSIPVSPLNTLRFSTLRPLATLAPSCPGEATWQRASASPVSPDAWGSYS
jgi:hypothetical protein